MSFSLLYGDQIIGYYEIPYNRILRLYASAVNKENNIAQDFIRSQVVPAPMNLDAAINFYMMIMDINKILLNHSCQMK